MPARRAKSACRETQRFFLALRRGRATPWRRKFSPCMQTRHGGRRSLHLGAVGGAGGDVGVVVGVVHRPRSRTLSDSGGRKTPGALPRQNIDHLLYRKKLHVDLTGQGRPGSHPEEKPPAPKRWRAYIYIYQRYSLSAAIRRQWGVLSATRRRAYIRQPFVGNAFCQPLVGAHIRLLSATRRHV